MSSHRFSTEDVKHAALWREDYILFCFLQVLFNIHIYKDTLSSLHCKTSISRVNLWITIILALTTEISLFL